MKKCIVAVAAHCGDAELGAGGTIAKYIAEGYRALVVVMTTSVAEPVIRESKVESRESNLEPVEVCELREREARAAATVLGHELEFVRLNERFYWHKGVRHYVDFTEQAPEVKLPGRHWLGLCSEATEATHKFLKELLLREEPELIFTHAVNDTCYEHWVTARFVAPVHAEIEHQKGTDAGLLLSWEPQPQQRSHILPVQTIIDITEHRETKHAALQAHASTIPAAALSALRSNEEYAGRMLSYASDEHLPLGEAFLSLRSGAPPEIGQA